MATVNEKFIVNLKGKDFVTYEGLLDMAHQNGLKSIEVEVIQLPTTENNMTCICMAKATTDEKIFIDIGDASPKSVNSMIAPHIIRMASTRAKARCLRDLNNIGMTVLEEIIDTDDIPKPTTSNPKNNPKNNSKNFPTNNDDKNKLINPEMATELKELIREKKADISTILKFNKVPTIEAMNINQYENAKKFLTKK